MIRFISLCCLFGLSFNCHASTAIPKNFDGEIEHQKFVFNGKISNGRISPGSTITYPGSDSTETKYTVLSDNGKTMSVRQDFDTGSIFIQVTKKRFDKLPIVPNSEYQYLFPNGIFATAQWKRADGYEVHKFYWSNRKKKELFGGLLSRRMPYFSSPAELSTAITKIAEVKGYLLTDPIEEFVTPKNYRSIKAPRYTAIHAKSESKYNHSSYAMGSYVNEAGAFMIFGEKEPNTQSRDYHDRNVSAVSDEGFIGVKVTIKNGSGLEDLKFPLAEIELGNGQKWYGKIDDKTLKKIGWWARRPDFNADIEQLTLYEQNHIVAEYSFENGFVNCTWLKNLPNKQMFYSNTGECDGILISKLPGKDRFNNNVEIWGNLIVHDAVRSEDRLVAGVLSNLYPYWMPNIPAEIRGDWWPVYLPEAGSEGEDFHHIYAGEYFSDGSLRTSIRHYLLAQTVFDGFINDKERNGLALCSIPQTYKGELGPCYWENDKRVDEVYQKEKARADEINRSFVCGDSAASFRETRTEVADKEFFNAEWTMEQLDYSWTRDTAPNMLDCDHCYVETHDAVETSQRRVNGALRRLDKLSEKLASDYADLSQYACLDQNELDEAYRLTESAIQDWQAYVEAAQQVVNEYAQSAKQLTANKKRNVRNFNRSISNEMAAHVMSLGDRLNNESEQKGWEGVNRLANQLVKESKVRRLADTQRQAASPVTHAQQPVVSGVGPGSTTAAPDRATQDKAAFKTACLRGKYNTWNDGVCVTNIPWGGPVCYDPSGEHCKTGEFLDGKSGRSGETGGSNTTVGGSVDRNEASSSGSSGGKNPAEQAGVTRQAKAACWETSQGWKCWGPLQKLFVSVGTLEEALSMVACETASELPSRRGIGRWSGLTMHLYDCKRPLKDHDVDVANEEMYN